MDPSSAAVPPSRGLETSVSTIGSERHRTETRDGGIGKTRSLSGSTQTQGKMPTKRASGLARKVGNAVQRDGDESTDIELGWILMISFRAIVSAIPPEKCIMGVCGVQIQASG